MNYFKKTLGFFTKQEDKFSDNKEQAQKLKIDPDNQQDVSEEMIQQLFTLSAKLMGQSQTKLSNELKLSLYGLYKQSTAGNCETDKPGMFDMVAKAKWTAWKQLHGMTKKQAMKGYIIKANDADPSISSKVQQLINGQISQKNEQNSDIIKQNSTPAAQGGKSIKKIQAVDYSDEYSHPYFKPIQKGLQLQSISHQLLLVKNNSPGVYPLHFAIDKQRVELVQKFLQKLTVLQIEEMVDEEGTGVLQYAQLLENSQILSLVQHKLKK